MYPPVISSHLLNSALRVASHFRCLLYKFGEVTVLDFFEELSSPGSQSTCKTFQMTPLALLLSCFPFSITQSMLICPSFQRSTTHGKLAGITCLTLGTIELNHKNSHSNEVIHMHTVNCSDFSAWTDYRWHCWGYVGFVQQHWTVDLLGFTAWWVCIMESKVYICCDEMDSSYLWYPLLTVRWWQLPAPAPKMSQYSEAMVCCGSVLYCLPRGSRL